MRVILVILCVEAGCSSPVADATVSEDVATVVHVTWHTATPSVGRVDYGPTEAYGTSTPDEPEPTTEHSRTLLGLHADTAYHFRVTTTAASGATRSGDDQLVTTGSIPGGVPPFEVREPVTNPLAGPLLLTSASDADEPDWTVEVIDKAGAPVWYWQPHAGVIASARPSPDGSGVFFVGFDEDDPDAATLTSVTWEGDETVFPLPYAHHDAVAAPDGGWAVIVSDLRTVDGETVAGDDIVEVAPDGTERTVWSAFDTLTVTENDGWPQSRFPDAADWTHANGLAYDADNDRYVVTTYHTRCVVAVDRASGVADWVLGGLDGQFTFVDDDGFGIQHAPEPFAGGVRIFDNANAAPTGARGVEYALDEAAHTATPTWSWSPAHPGAALALGDVHRWDDGSALLVWGLEADVYVSDAAGASAGQLGLVDPGQLGQVTVLEGMY